MTATVAIIGCGSDDGLKRVFQELAAVLQLRCEFSHPGNLDRLVGRVRVLNSEPAVAQSSTSVPEFQFVAGKPNDTDSRENTAVEFSNASILPAVLRGRRIPLGKESGWQFLDEPQLGEVVASINGRPVWRIVRQFHDAVWSVGTQQPRLADGERLSHLFNGETFLPLLPLYLFLRALSPTARWQAPPLRACMVVDDPNLHACTYGYVNYASILRLARDTPFHAAMAMVPLDTWWTSTEAATLFRDNPRRLSLVIHGNDHLHYELARPRDEAACRALVAQSLTRIEAFENKTGVSVDRVMAPPHGVCALGMFSALRAAGFEGMTTNRWSLWRHNPPEQLQLNFGLCPSDWLGGLPVLDRFRFNSSISLGEFFMAAILGKPIIPYGHHQDFADDMIHVRTIIDTINALPVRWVSLREMFETNYESCLESGVLHLRLFSRRVKLTLQPGVSVIQIDPIGLQKDDPRVFAITWHGNRVVAPAQSLVCDLPTGIELEIRLTGETVSKKGMAPSRTLAPPVLRRIAAEIRDRLKI